MFVNSCRGVKATVGRTENDENFEKPLKGFNLLVIRRRGLSGKRVDRMRTAVAPKTSQRRNGGASVRQNTTTSNFSLP